MRIFPMISKLIVLLLAFSGLNGQTISARLDWDSSPSSGIVGYHLYRSTSAQGVYQRLTSSPLTSRTFTDSTVQYGGFYLYRATAVSTDGTESLFSNEAALDLICRGDVNVDRQRNVLDVIQIQNHIVGNLLLNGNSLTAADVDGNGSVTVLDAVRLLNHVVGNAGLPDCVM